MRYNDFVMTVTERQETGYPVSATESSLGRAAHVAPPPDNLLTRSLASVAAIEADACDETLLCEAGVNLFRWLLAGPLETHLRLAWDRAEQAGRGLRLRLVIDPPEIAAWPWELLHDPVRDHTFATAVATPLVRFLDQTGSFGALVEQEAELPLHMLVVLPQDECLDLAQERALIQDAVQPLQNALRVHLLSGPVTRTALSDALLAQQYDLLHFAGHGGFIEGQVYIALNQPDGTPDYVDGGTLARLGANHRSLKLAVMNVCSSGRQDTVRAFRGLAPQWVRRGVPAVVAMQYQLSDQASLTFAREFYRQLCTGENAGQVDVAVAHARNMLAVRRKGDRSFAAPVVFTHARDGVIFSLPREAAVRELLDPSSQRARLAMFVGSLQASMDFEDDWSGAEQQRLEEWRLILRRAEQAYRLHLAGSEPEVQQAARQGLALIQSRLATLDSALSGV